MLRKFINYLSFGCILIFLTGCAATQPPKAPVVVGELSLKELCERYHITYNLDPISQAIFLSRGDVSASTMIGSDMVIIGEQRIRVSEPLRLKEGAVIAPRDFKSLVIDRLRVKRHISRARAISKVKRIVIDAGHGGKDPGAIGSSGMYEKIVVLDIAKQLKKLLEREGFEVIMTRERDEFISLKERTIIASEAKADLFVSIHANAHSRRGINGVEVYSLRGLDAYELNEAQRQENERKLFRHLRMKRNDGDLHSIVADMLYTYKQGEAAELAEDISFKTAHYLKAKNLGGKTSRFFVLRNTLVPAILVEVGFLTNPKEERLLKTRAYRRKVAYALARGIKDYVEER